jgi:type IV pilus assembly protein PilE
MFRRQSGFSLIEIVVAIAVVGILASIAYPTYTSSVRKTRRAEAEAELVNRAQQMERYFSANATYVGGFVGNPPAGYTLTATNVTATGYTLRATRTVDEKASQLDDQCGDLTFTSTGVRGIVNQNSGLTANDCW